LIVVFSFVLAVISLWYAKTQLVFAKGQLDEARHLMKADHVRSQRKLAMDMCSNWSNFTSPETASVTRLIEKMTPEQCGALANLDKLSINTEHKHHLLSILQLRFPDVEDQLEKQKLGTVYEIDGQHVLYIRHLQSVISICWNQSCFPGRLRLLTKLW
jgi:hypothetical protein